MRKIVSFGFMLFVLTASAQKTALLMESVKCDESLRQTTSARAAEAGDNVVSTQTPNGTLWLKYDKVRNEVTLDYLTRDSFPYPNYPSYVTKVNLNKDLTGDLYLPGIIQNGEAKGARLVKIKNTALAGCEKLTSIIVPSTVEELEPSALRTTQQVQAVVIPSTVRMVGGNHKGLQVTAYLVNTQTLVVNSEAALADSVCYWHDNIKTLIVGDSVKTINYMNFRQCDSLTSVTLGRNIEEIGDQAFMGCPLLRCIHLPASLKKIAPMAFHYGSGYYSNFDPTPLERIEVENYDTYRLLVESKVNLLPATRIYLAGQDITGTYTPQEGQATQRLEEGATEIPDNFFANDTTLTSFVVPETVIRIGYCAFENCKNLRSIVIPNSVTVIDTRAFGCCEKLKKVTLPAHLKTISSNLFVQCSSLEEVVMNDELESIQGVVFSGCSQLTSLTIPANVSSIVPDAFGGCGPQLQVTFLSDKAGMTWENHMLLSTDKTILYDASNTDEFIIPETVTDVRSIPYFITDFNIPAQVTRLPEVINPLRSITVDKGNTVFTVSEGSLYSKDMKTLMAIPQCVTGRYVVPETVDSICPNAVRVNVTNYWDIFNLSVFKLDRVLPTQLNLNINSNDQLIYLLPYDYYDRYQWAWNVNVFDVTTYVEPEVSPIKIGQKQADKYSLRVKVDGWPAGGQPSRLVIDNLEYPFQPADSTFFVDRLDSIRDRLNKKEGKYNSQRYIPFTVYATKGSDVLPARDSVYYSGSSTLFSLVQNVSYTSFEGILYLHRVVNSDQFYVECDIRSSNKYPYNIVDTQTFTFSRADLRSYSSLYGSSANGYKFIVEDLKPGYMLGFRYFAVYNGEKREFSSNEAYIPDFIMSGDHLSCGTTTVGGRITYDAKELPVIRKGVTGHGQGDYFTITGLNPGTVVPLEYYVTALIAGRDTTFRKTIYLPLAQLELTSLLPTDINSNSARLLATTTIEDRETAVGFEWRRYDAPEEVASYRVDGAVYEGTLKATLTGLDKATYYRFRPYLQTADSTYYGEWLIFGTNSQDGMLAPEVHTTDAIMTDTDFRSYVFTGYVLPGSESIAEQGFEYWPTAQTGSRVRVRAAAETMNTVTAEGLRMTAEVSELLPQTEYAVRSYAVTSSQTVYGNVLTFTTTGLSGITDILNSAAAFDIYTIDGKKIRQQVTTFDDLPKGIYIVNGQKAVVR